ncbi:hypothetical protein ACOSQ3_008186 [Xanthoceras sorbifolium]
MVTSNISFVLVRFLLSAFLLSLLLVCSVKETYGFEERECLTHTFQLSSLFASSVCNHSTKANERVSTFKIVDKYGPCFQPNRQRAVYPSHTDILRSDRAPIKSIHARLSMDSGLRRDMIEIKSASIPAKDGASFRTSNFFVTVGFGTPKKDLSLEPMFDRTKSSTYVTVPTTNKVCKYVRRDGSVSTGFFSKETLTLSSSNNINGFLFVGCPPCEGTHPTQTAQKHNKIFSYCLPSSASLTGYLTLGSQSLLSNIKYTKIVAHKSPYYDLDLVGIGLAGKKLNIAESIFTKPGTIIDLGTVFTYLPPQAYPTFRTAFRQVMSAYLIAAAHPGDDLDTCYDFSKSSTVIVPKINFFFRDGTVVGMPRKLSLVTYTKTQVCLGFAPYEPGDDEIIIGNQAQRTMEIVYDLLEKGQGLLLMVVTHYYQEK